MHHVIGMMFLSKRDLSLYFSSLLSMWFETDAKPGLSEFGLRTEAAGA